jgi:hypothetical protein
MAFWSTFTNDWSPVVSMEPIVKYNNFPGFFKNCATTGGRGLDLGPGLSKIPLMEKKWDQDTFTGATMEGTRFLFHAEIT